MTPDQLGNQARGGEGWLEKQNRPIRAVEPLLMVALMAIIFACFYGFAATNTDWEMLSTKHYWSAEAWYYGGFGWNIAETPTGYRALQMEGLSNYTNLPALQETCAPNQARARVQGYPGTERLDVPFLIYVLLHVTEKPANMWTHFWILNVLLWLATIYLTYRIAAEFYVDRYTPWLSAILVTMYPALTLTFNGIKLQPLGTTYLLLGIYLFERRLSQADAPLKCLGLATLLFFGNFANAGWVLLLAYVFFRAWWLTGRSRWVTLGALSLAVAIARLWLAGLTGLYHLPSVQADLGVDFHRKLAESYAWFRAAWSHQDLSRLKFLGYPGSTFFTGFLPLIARSFAAIHAPLLVLALVGAVVEARARIFAYLTVPMLLVGHSGHIMAVYVYHYGYMSFPAGMMVIFSAAGALSWLLTRRRWFFRILALAFCVYAGLGFIELKRQAGLYFGGHPETYQRRLYIYHGDEADHLTY